MGVDQLIRPRSAGVDQIDQAGREWGKTPDQLGMFP